MVGWLLAWFGSKVLPPRDDFTLLSGEGGGRKPEYLEKTPDGQPSKKVLHTECPETRSELSVSHCSGDK